MVQIYAKACSVPSACTVALSGETSCSLVGDSSRTILGDCSGCVSAFEGEGESRRFGKDLLGVTFGGGFLTSNKVGTASRISFFFISGLLNWLSSKWLAHMV